MVLVSLRRDRLKNGFSAVGTGVEQHAVNALGGERVLGGRGFRRVDDNGIAKCRVEHPRKGCTRLVAVADYQHRQ